MYQPSRFEQLRHELRTCLNHILGYGEILQTDVREYGRDEFLPGLRNILKIGEKIRKLISFFFGDETDLLEIATPEDIRKAFYVPLMQIIGDARRLLVQFKTQEPIFVRDMEQLLAVANQMLDIVEAEIVDLEIEDLLSNRKPSVDIEDLPSFKEFEAEVDDALAGARAKIPGTVLIVDDSVAVQNLLARNLSALGHATHALSTGQEALQYLKTRQVDVIILDVLMPGMTGYQVLRELKKTPGLRDIPVIMISSLDSSENIAQCIKLGAEDYLSKNFEPVILRARVDACMEKRQLQKQQEVYLQAIIESQDALARELSDAADYISGLLPRPIRNDIIETGLAFIPSAQLGGDFVGHHWLDHETMAAYVLDVSGHGIRSALLSVSLSNTLGSQALPGANFYDPGDVLTQLNNTFQQKIEANSYFTIWYGVYNVRTRLLRYATGGSPPAFLVMPSEGGDAVPVHELSTRDILLGAEDDHIFETKSETLKPGSLLYIFSDGIAEIIRANGKMLGLPDLQRIFAMLSGGAQENIDEIINQVRALSMTEAFDDDISILALKILG